MSYFEASCQLWTCTLIRSNFSSVFVRSENIPPGHVRLWFPGSRCRVHPQDQGVQDWMLTGWWSLLNDPPCYLQAVTCND